MIENYWAVLSSSYEPRNDRLRQLEYSCEGNRVCTGFRGCQDKTAPAWRQRNRPATAKKLNQVYPRACRYVAPADRRDYQPDQ